VVDTTESIATPHFLPFSALKPNQRRKEATTAAALCSDARRPRPSSPPQKTQPTTCKELPQSTGDAPRCGCSLGMKIKLLKN